MIWIIGVLTWLGLVLVATLFYLRQDGDKSYDVELAAQNAAKANAKCEVLQKSFNELQEKIDSFTREIHDFEVEQKTAIQTTIKVLLEDMQNVKARQINIEKKLVSERSIHLKITEPIPVEIKHQAPPPPPVTKKKPSTK